MAAPIGNKYALGLTDTGRPPIYSDPEVLHKKCLDFFNDCIETSTKATITGLALYLGFESRKTLYNYGEKEDFLHIIKRACLTVENSYEQSGGTIDIFALKNMGWVDKTEVDNNIKVNEQTFKIGDTEITMG